MYEQTLEGFLRLANSQFAKESKYMIVSVSINGAVPEIIINEKENFESKIEYYKNAYNEDLTLKANPNIKIVDYDFFNEFTFK